MGLVYLATWMVDFYGFHVGKYTSPMDPMGTIIIISIYHYFYYYYEWGYSGGVSRFTSHNSMGNVWFIW